MQYPCSTPSTVANCFSSSTLMYSGPGRSEILARSSTLVVWVALNSMVCLSSLGRILMICRISSSKPISRMRSASSMMSDLRFLKTKGVFCRWSSRRPGVAMMRLTPLASLSASARRFAPPMTMPYVWLWCLSRSRATLKICSASSRVGLTTMTPVPLRGLKRSECSISMAGIRNASVLPLPVLAAPSTSLPVSSGGIPRFWISVMVVKPISSIAFRVLSERESSWKEETSAPAACGRERCDWGRSALSAVSSSSSATAASSSPPALSLALDASPCSSSAGAATCSSSSSTSSTSGSGFSTTLVFLTFLVFRSVASLDASLTFLFLLVSEAMLAVGGLGDGRRRLVVRLAVF